MKTLQKTFTIEHFVDLVMAIFALASVGNIAEYMVVHDHNPVTSYGVAGALGFGLRWRNGPPSCRPTGIVRMSGCAGIVPLVRFSSVYRFRTVRFTVRFSVTGSVILKGSL